MPRADARLLAIDDVSLWSERLCPGSRGGCCWGSVAGAGAVLEGAGLGVRGWDAGGGEVVDGSAGALVAGCSCWERRTAASRLCSSSSSWRVRKACSVEEWIVSRGKSCI